MTLSYVLCGILGNRDAQDMVPALGAVGTHRDRIPSLIPHSCFHQTSNKCVISVSMPDIRHTEINQIHILGTCINSNVQSASGSLQSAFSQEAQLQSLQQSHEVVSIIVPIWRIRKLRPRAVKRCPCDCAAKKQPSWNMNPVLLYVF